MDKTTFPDLETKYFPTGKNGGDELYVKKDDGWQRVTGMTTGPAVQYFVEMSPEEAWKERNIIEEKHKF